MSDLSFDRTAYPQKAGQLAEAAGLLWSAAVAAFLALAACKTLLERTHPAQASLTWALVYGLLFCLALTWLACFSRRLMRRRPGGAVGLLGLSMALHGPLLLLSITLSLAIFISDEFHHHNHSMLHPTPAVILLLATTATAVAQEALLAHPAAGFGSRLLEAALGVRRWVLPGSLLLAGFLQGASYLWVIGNDFTRYWTVADAAATMAGYPASHHLPVYIKHGMHPYSIEFPLFPLLLLASFSLAGHDTVGAHLPGLAANIALPLLLYGFFRKAGLMRPFAFAAGCLLVFFPFLRLYTLNAPVPDAVFIALLVAAGYLFLHLTGERHPADEKLSEETKLLAPTGQAGRGPTLPHAARSAGGRDAPGPGSWAAFGALGGLVTLTRPEGVLFAGVMFLGLAPHLLNRRLWAAAGAFLLLVAPFSLLMQATFGIPWPRNVGNSMALHHIAGNLDMLGRASLRWYAHAFGMPPSDFAMLVAVLAAASIAGTVWIAAERRPLALLPVASWIHIALVFSVHPIVAGADQWFDFFRHLSYGLPFISLSIFFLIGRICDGIARWLPARGNRRIPVAPLILVLMLGFACYELNLLNRPAATYGKGARQLLTSDVWVSLPDIIANRYQLPVLTFSRQSGVLLISPECEYTPRHLREVKTFFKPVSSLHTGRGSGYQLSSGVVMMFGFLFTLLRPSQLGRGRNDRQ